MYIAIDFGISNTDIAVSKNEETSFFSTPTLSTTISPNTIRDLFKKHNGNLFNSGGDSFMAEFASAVDAVECAVEFQEEMKKT